MRHPELLIPASSLEVLKTAVVFGADAVYIGGEAFGLRAKAKNFSMEDMKEGIAFAHEHGVKGICDGEYSRAQWRPCTAWKPILRNSKRFGRML